MLPSKNAIDTTGLDLKPDALDELLAVNKDDWRGEAANLGEFFGKFGTRLPEEMDRQRQQLIKRLG
jgi:phosphoenolpyruvate carboxykinase (GTP)